VAPIVPRRSVVGRPSTGRPRLRAALTAAAVAVPVTIIIAFALARPQSSRSPSANSTVAVDVAPVPSNSSTVEPCAQVLSDLPIQLNGANPRIVHTTQAVAWGNPAIVLRCGVARPADLAPPPKGPAEVAGINGLNWLVDDGKRAIVYTLVDRAIYIEVSLPAGADPSASMPVLSDAVAKALPAPVCYVQDKIVSAPDLPMCTRRP
jgi:Protein of unknown function (DUF3515)